MTKSENKIKKTKYQNKKFERYEYIFRSLDTCLEKLLKNPKAKKILTKNFGTFVFFLHSFLIYFEQKIPSLNSGAFTPDSSI